MSSADFIHTKDNLFTDLTCKNFIKKFKNKVKDANIMLELRERQHYVKKSDKNRERKNLARLRQRYKQEKENNCY